MTTTPSPAASTPFRLARLPWFTALGCVVAVAFWFLPGAFNVFVYDRTKVFSGQVWRLFTAHWVHFSSSHLIWNLVVFAAAGGWLEFRHRTAMLWTLLAASVAVGIEVIAFERSLQLYAGISGLASGLLIGLATWGLRKEPSKRWLWYCVTALFAAKLALELVSEHKIFSSLTPLEIHSVPLAHLVGAAAGVLVVLTVLKKPNPSPAPN